MPSVSSEDLSHDCHPFYAAQPLVPFMLRPALSHLGHSRKMPAGAAIDMMRACVYDRGAKDQNAVSVGTVPIPYPDSNEVLVKVHAASLNP